MGRGVENWLDEKIINAKTSDDHLIPIDQTLERLPQNWLSVNIQKSHSCATSQEFVGMIVDRYRVRSAGSNLTPFASFPSHQMLSTSELSQV